MSRRKTPGRRNRASTEKSSAAKYTKSQRVWAPDVSETLQFALSVFLPKGKENLSRQEYEKLLQRKLKRLVEKEENPLKRVSDLAPLSLIRQRR